MQEAERKKHVLERYRFISQLEKQIQAVKQHTGILEMQGELNVDNPIRSEITQRRLKKLTSTMGPMNRSVPVINHLPPDGLAFHHKKKIRDENNYYGTPNY